MGSKEPFPTFALHLSNFTTNSIIVARLLRTYFTIITLNHDIDSRLDASLPHDPGTRGTGQFNEVVRIGRRSFHQPGAIVLELLG
jgi:hypothetical protein